MPKFVNKNSHPIRVRNGDGSNLRRVRSGEVVEADGVLADNLTATTGVESASSADEKSWQAKLDAQYGPRGEASHSTESLQEVVDSVHSNHDLVIRRVTVHNKTAEPRDVRLFNYQSLMVAESSQASGPHSDTRSRL